MIQYFKSIDNHIEEIEKPENESWVNLTPPFRDEDFEEISKQLDIPIEFLRDSLDIDERPRYEIEDNVKLIVIKTPTENKSFNDSNASFITIPICIILTHNHIVTVNSFENVAIKKFLSAYRKHHPEKRNWMILKVLEKVAQNFMEHLKEINQLRNKYELELTETHRNEELLHLMQLQKSLVYIVSALRGNELLMMKMLRTNILGLNEEEREHLDDIIVDTSQALEMANIYTNIVNSTLDTYNSIISNNLNRSMNRLILIALTFAFPILLTVLFLILFQSGQTSWKTPLIIFLSAVAGMSGIYFFRKK